MQPGLSFVVNYQTQSFLYDNVNPSMLVSELKDDLTNKTGIEKQGQKLVWKGKILQDTQSLQDIGLKSKAKIMLTGSPQNAITDVQNVKVSPQPFKPRGSNLYKNVKKSGPNEDDKYTFHRIAVLPQFSNQAGAQKILEKLKSDLGIRGIMKHYKWSVGSLIELSPAEQTILGYNRNKGEVIALRLRTDDLEGFRTYDSIRKVLLHELAHMVHSEHDSNFHTLNRQLNKDVINLDWTSRGGQALSSAQYYNPEEEEEVEGPLFEGGVFRLGGKSKDEAGPARDNETPEQRRERLARAVLIRLTKEEKEVVEGCGSGKEVGGNTTKSE